MARVKINGVDVGGIWTVRYQPDVAKAVKPGINTIDITVVNTSVNRLIGDSKLQADQRKTWTVVNPCNKNSRLQPLGLMGTVTISMAVY